MQSKWNICGWYAKVSRVPMRSDTNVSSPPWEHFIKVPKHELAHEQALDVSKIKSKASFLNNHNQSIEMGSKFDFQLCRMIAHYWSPSAKKTKGTLPTKEETKNRNCWTKSSSNYWTLHLTLFENPFYIIVWVKMKGIYLLNIWWSPAMISQFGFAKRGLDSGLLPLSPVVWPL